MKLRAGLWTCLIYRLEFKLQHTIHILSGTLFPFCFSSPACKIEVPERLTVSHEALVQSGLADRCVSVPVREATDADILLVHRSVLMPSKSTASFSSLSSS